MGIGERLKKERVRLGLNQSDFAAIGGAHRKSQGNYELGERYPDAAYLAAIAAAGADIRYIVTGERDGPPPEALSANERELLALYRVASLTGKAAAIGALQGIAGRSARIGQQINAPVSGGVAGRNLITNQRKK